MVNIPEELNGKIDGKWRERIRKLQTDKEPIKLPLSSFILRLKHADLYPILDQAGISMPNASVEIVFGIEGKGDHRRQVPFAVVNTKSSVSWQQLHTLLSHEDVLELCSRDGVNKTRTHLSVGTLDNQDDSSDGSQEKRGYHKQKSDRQR